LTACHPQVLRLQDELLAAGRERERLEAALNREVSSLNRLEADHKRGERELLELLKRKSDEHVCS
jgi:hypothetical protein